MAEDVLEVPSPCIDVCKLDDDGWLCVGCYRTVEEIRRWKEAGSAEKRAIRRAAAARAPKPR
jgi:predicted Fe-S protein YdhL (DUF1289 family)